MGLVERQKPMAMGQPKEMAKAMRDGGDVKTGKVDFTQVDEDPEVKRLRLNLLALAKRAPLDKITRLPIDLVPEPIRHIVPTIARESAVPSA